jgi:hypothetical protein
MVMAAKFVGKNIRTRTGELMASIPYFYRVNLRLTQTKLTINSLPTSPPELGLSLGKRRRKDKWLISASL